MLTLNDIRHLHLSPSDILLFWGHEGQPYACLSQWYPSHIVVDGVYYSCAEQYMMAQKARIFGDTAALAAIMATRNPMEMKKAGRRVAGFVSTVWDNASVDAVVRANIAKFSQNPRLRELLLSTGHKILAEASPYDTIWGIGLTADSTRALRPSQWPGQNRLGFALMEVRDSLRAAHAGTPLLSSTLIHL